MNKLPFPPLGLFKITKLGYLCFTKMVIITDSNRTTDLTMRKRDVYLLRTYMGHSG